VDGGGGEGVSGRGDKDRAAIESLIDELERLRLEHGSVAVGIDVLGGIASLLAAMFAEVGFALVHVPGLAVDRARQGTSGGEHKSGPRGARGIARQVRTRPDPRPVDGGRAGGDAPPLLRGPRAE